MTVDEIKNKRADLSAELSRLVTEFEQSSGLRIMTLGIDRPTITTFQGGCSSSVQGSPIIIVAVDWEWED